MYSTSNIVHKLFSYVLSQKTGVEPYFKMEERRASDIFLLKFFLPVAKRIESMRYFVSRRDRNIGAFLAASLMHRIAPGWSVWIPSGTLKRTTQLVAIPGVSYVYTTTGNPKLIPDLNFFLAFECMNQHGKIYFDTPVNSSVRCKRVYEPPCCSCSSSFQETSTLSYH